MLLVEEIAYIDGRSCSECYESTSWHSESIRVYVVLHR